MEELFCFSNLTFGKEKVKLDYVYNLLTSDDMDDKLKGANEFMAAATTPLQKDIVRRVLQNINFNEYIVLKDELELAELKQVLSRIKIGDE